MPTPERPTQDEIWMRNLAEFLRELFAEELAESEARGEIREARRFLLRQLRRRFDSLPEAVVERVENADRDWCEAMVDRLFDVGSLDELGLSENGS